MPDQLQLRGGTTTEHNSFTGALREVTVDTTKKTLVVHDGTSAGGTALMKESGATAASSVQIGTGGVERFKITSNEVVFNETSTDTDFRIEGNGEANLFKVDAGNDQIGIGTSSPSTRFHVEGSQDSLLFLKSTDAGSGLAAADNSGSSIIQNIGGSFRILTGGDPNVVGTASTEKFRITGGGNVGIGTASPSSALHVKGHESAALFEGTLSTSNIYLDVNAAADRRGVIRFQAAGTNKWSIGRGDSDELTENSFFIGTGSDGGSAAKLVINSSGNVGIGTTSPGSKLHVADTNPVIASFHRSDGGTNDQARISLGALSSNPPYQRGVNLIAENNGSGHDFVISTSPSHSLSPTEKARFDSSGRLLLGTTTLGEGSADNLTVADSGHCGITIRSGSSSGGNLFFTDATSDQFQGYVQYNHSSNHLGFGTQKIERMRIDSSGNVGIGTTNPSEKLNVSGNILATGTITPNSDIAFKKDIEPLTNVLNKVTQLIGINFTYKNNNEKSMGLVAQDVEKVFPELIRGKEGNKSLNYMGLTGALIEAIKELSAKVEALEAA